MQTQHPKPQPLPLSIVVRNLFPPLAVTLAAATSASSSSSSSSGVSDAPDSADLNNDDQNDDPMMMTTTSTSIEGRCARASQEILHRLRLDIITKNRSQTVDAGGDSGDGDSDETATSLVVHSMEQSHSTSHPRWDHVNERLQSTTLSSTVSIADCSARFVILHDTLHGDDAKVGNEQERGIVLAKITLDPSKLRCLPSVSQNTDTVNNDNVDSDSSRRNSSNINSSGMHMIIPHTLPPNTILMHYDDGYTRVLPIVYSLLLQRGVIHEEENKRDGVVLLDRGKVKPQELEVPLFEDRAFDLLLDKSTSDVVMPMEMDTALESASAAVGVAAAELLPSSKKNDAPSMVIFDDSIFDLMGSSDGSGARQTAAVTTGANVATSADDVTGAKTTDVELQSHMTRRQEDDENDIEKKRLVTAPAVAVEREVTGQLLPSEEELPLLPLPASNIEKQSVTTCDEEEIEELRRLIHLERKLLEEDWRRVAQESNRIKSMMQQVQLLENETLDIMRNVKAERTTLLDSELQLEANRIHLLQQLRLIFPIKLAPITNVVHPPNHPQHQYTISNIPLPEDIHTPTVSDDQVSLALGLVCHLVSLTSKYLAVPLRYPLICKFSRSAVLFDWSSPQGGGSGGGSLNTNHTANSSINSNNNNESNIATTPSTVTRAVYPLFRERNVIDREQLDYGRILLERNVNCLLQVRNVPYRKEWNVLAKMDKLLLHVVEGGD